MNKTDSQQNQNRRQFSIVKALLGFCVVALGGLAGLITRIDFFSSNSVLLRYSFQQNTSRDNARINRAVTAFFAVNKALADAPAEVTVSCGGGCGCCGCGGGGGGCCGCGG